ncbi:MAG TPA: glycosyltransferase family 39 protein [Polyangiaceae bacterium]
MYLALSALVLRGMLVAWARDRFPPADDGSFYQVVATRIAHGLGYTWHWPDGAVTYAAHYPVGYPALIGVAYALFGSTPSVAMSLNAVIGALSVFALHGLLARRATRAGALLGAALLAFHPGLVMYTPALMTEGVAAELLVVALALALWTQDRGGSGRLLLLLGLLCGGLTLLRPQLLLMSPIFGACAVSGAFWRRARAATGVLLVSLLTCLPWTLRNCQKMDHCAFVSANGGWNLLIGSLPNSQGSWLPIENESVPPPCRAVFGEVEKDRCFGRAGLDNIRRAPLAFLQLIPRKLSVTFDYFGAAGHYLHTSNWRAFDESRKVALGVVETLWVRLILLLAIAQAALAHGPRRVTRLTVSALSLPFVFLRPAWLGYLGFVLAVCLLGSALARRPVLFVTACLVLTTAVTHALFFGAGRYGLVCAALLCAAAVNEAGLTSSSVVEGTPSGSGA